MLRDDLESARRVMGRIAPLLQALGAEVNPGPIKQAMSMRGLCEAGMRLPVDPGFGKHLSAVGTGADGGGRLSGELL